MPDNIPGGYHGKILRVDLSRETTRVERVDELFCRKYLGGAGFIAHTLLNDIKGPIDPLGPENKLVFATGPVTGILLPGSGRHCVGGISPLTGGVGKSEVGEFWGAELKRAGFDGLIIEGTSPRPVYLWVHDGEGVLQDAGHLWGQKTKETQEAIRKELGSDKIRVALIGPGGENLVKYACIMHGLFNAAGRCGLGAVMGSKKLKAIAVKGTQAPPVANPDGVKTLREWLASNMQRVAGLHDFGTSANMSVFEKIGNLPVRNFQDGAFPEIDKISAHRIRETMRVGMRGCFACPIRCKKVVELRDPYDVDEAYGGPEYETLAALGSNCGIDDLGAIAKGSELCNAYSIDTISTGGTIAFGMECFEKGLLTREDTGGIDLRFGNAGAMLQMIERIARREGIGDLLAEGSARAAGKIGRGAESFALHVKKQEIPMHEPRLNKGMALGYMVNPHGADHCCNMIDMVYSGFNTKGSLTAKNTVSLGMIESLPFEEINPYRVALFRLIHFMRVIADSLVYCEVIPYSYEQLVELTSAVTGWSTTTTEQLRIAERIVTIYRLINVRQGLRESDDVLPARFFAPKRDEGLSGEAALDPEKMEKAKRYYYFLMGWDEKGVPTQEKLEELGLSDHKSW